MEAAGGLVENDCGEYLAIKRLGKWDLPKGKIEKGEKPEECALREVEEECGIHNINIKNNLCNTYHTYQLKGRWILKKTYWYRMEYNGNEELIPQIEEDITDVIWTSDNHTYIIKSNTYKSILDVLIFGGK